MCKKSGEIVVHFLLHCLTGELWSMVLSMFRVEWVMPRGVMELLACWQGGFGCYKSIEFWKSTPRCLMWYIWRESNDRSFERREW